MKFSTLILRSLTFHARAHLGVVLGAAVGSAALIGALIVGDSVRISLKEMALVRLGKVQTAMGSGDRFFRSQLGGQRIAAVLQLPATAAAQDASARANHVQLLGVTAAFWQLADQPPAFSNLPPDSVVLNEPLAHQLAAKVGDTILLRVEKPSLLSRDAPISPQQDYSVAMRFKVQAIASDEQFGRFSLQANQAAPFNAFVNLSQLQERVGQTNRANLLLVPGGSDIPYRGPATNQATLDDKLREEAQALSRRLRGVTNWQPIGNRWVVDRAAGLFIVEDSYQDSADNINYTRDAYGFLWLDWDLADAQLDLRELPAGGVELRSTRIFLDPPVVEAARKISPDAAPVLTYLVNDLQSGSAHTPYSMVTAMGAPIVPPDMRDDEILINDWLAQDLSAKPGDTLSLAYFVIGNGRALEERTNSFRIRGVVPMTGAAADRGLMPDFPGLAQADSTSDWDAGFPIQFNKIRPKDEQYWKQYRGTPKAFVTLAAGQKLWANRFGDVTAMRFPKTAGTMETIRAALLKTISPASVGLEFQPVREQALAASSQGVDFGGLFIGFSFFLIVAALLLMGLLFQFGLEQRAVEIGTLLALGFRPRQVRRLFLLEGAALALVGGIIGAAGGIIYAKAMLLGLTTVWRSAVGTSALRYHATAETLLIGTFASTLVGVATIWLALRRQARKPARELLAQGAESRSDISSPSPPPGERAGVGGKTRKSSRSLGIWIGPISGVLALAMIFEGMREGANSSADTFFSAGALLLTAGLGFAAVWLAHLGRGGSAKLTLAGLGLRGCGRRRNRSLATVGLLACGVFLIVAIGAFRIDANQTANQRSSGTGGFALIGESALPVTYDLNSSAGREFYGLTADAMKDVNVVAFRVHDGDEASCLNLNRAQKPRVLGVSAEKLRGTFTFAEEMKSKAGKRGWDLLGKNSSNADLRTEPLNPPTRDSSPSPPDEGGGRGGAYMPEAHAEGDAAMADEVPAIGDENSILWAMGKKIGDTVDYTDARGHAFKLRLVGAVANSVLQGSLIIDEAEFVKRFPDESGYRMFLVDAPTNRVADVSAMLTRGLQDAGLEMTPAAQRLNMFNAVQNTYLSTFQVLGGLGLLLGSAGLGVVVLRNVQERRGELALLLAVGFRRRALQGLVLSEHGALLGLGLAVGIMAAVIGVLPALLSPGSQIPYGSLATTLGAVLLNGLLWTWAATRLALRGRLLDGLRSE